MPAESRSQQKLFALALHNPSALNPENRGLAHLDHATLHEFASTATKGLPQHVRKKDGPRKIRVRAKHRYQPGR